MEQSPKNDNKHREGVNRGMSLQEMYEIIRKQTHTDGCDGEPYDYDSDTDDCYCE